MGYAQEFERRAARRRLYWIIGVPVLVVVIIVAVVPAVVVTNNNKRNRYPNYTRLNYALQETCKSLPLVAMSALQLAACSLQPLTATYTFKANICASLRLGSKLLGQV